MILVMTNNDTVKTDHFFSDFFSAHFFSIELSYESYVQCQSVACLVFSLLKFLAFTEMFDENRKLSITLYSKVSFVNISNYMS